MIVLIERKSGRGFTLVELLITLLVMSILLGLAAPSFADLIRRQRMQSATVEWMSLVAFARNEAIKSGHAVSITQNDSSFQMLDARTDEVLREWQLPNIDTELKNFDDLQFTPPLGVLDRDEACIRLTDSSVDSYQRFIYLSRSGQSLVFDPSSSEPPSKVQTLCAS